MTKPQPILYTKCTPVIALQEKIIRSQSNTIDGTVARRNRLVRVRFQKLFCKAHAGAVSGATIASYSGVFLLVVSLVAMAYHPPVSQGGTAEASAAPASQQISQQTSQQMATTSSVDKVMATNLASSLAESADMPISNNVANLSQSLQVESVLAQADTSSVSKPQIVQPTAETRTVQQYTTVAGDTVPTVAQKYNISSDTVKWANNLNTDALEPGRTLAILPVSGVLYTVKSGDTLDGIASKYNVERAVVVSYNDLDLSGEPAAGVQLILPGGTLPTTERPGYVAPQTNNNAVLGGGSYGNYGGGYGNAYAGAISAGNKYAWGNCTWYAYERREQLGNPVGSYWGNASTWAYNARLAGFLVNGTPSVGAIMQNGGGYGHVAIIEAVNPGVSVTISEMNGYRFGGGFARVGHGDISWGEATSGMYQYIH